MKLLLLTCTRVESVILRIMFSLVLSIIIRINYAAPRRRVSGQLK